MRKFLFLFLLFSSSFLHAQFAFEMKVDYAMRVQNSDNFAVSGSISSGRMEDNKTYYLEDGTQFKIKNIISAKSATSVPVASAGENVSISIESPDFKVERGESMRVISSRPGYSGASVKTFSNKLPEGGLSCKVNGKVYESNQVSKPVYIREADVLDLFFEAEDKSVIWIQINNFSEIKMTPHITRTDTSVKDRSLVCKLAFMPKGYLPTDLPNNYVAFEDQKGNAGVIITNIDRYHKKIALEFSGILRPNQLLLEERPTAGLYYISEGRVDQVGWDEF